MNKLVALRKSKKGFTLVEIIVVLVILAILAAIAIPSLTGYIDKAKEKQILTEARTVYVAAQAVATDDYGTLGSAIKSTDITAGEINDLIGEDLLKDAGNTATGTFTLAVSTEGKVTAFTYTKDSKTATYNATGFSISKASTVSG